MKVAIIKEDKGMSKIGEDKLIMIAGSNGVILKKSKYENKFDLCCCIIPLNFINSLGISLTTIGFPSTHETQ